MSHRLLLLASLAVASASLCAQPEDDEPDAVVRTAIYNHVGLMRLGLFLVGAALLFGYGTFLNLAPFEFGKVVGLYVATLFVIWQLINFVAFRTLPTLPILVGGTLIIAGGAVITYWQPG